MFYKLLNSYVQRFSFPKRGLKYFLKIMRLLRIADKTYLKRLPGNIYMKVHPGEHIQQQLFWYGYYEKTVGIILKKILNLDSIFIDVGANIGHFSLLAALQSPKGRIIALEPVSYLFNSLRENISLNKFSNIEAINIAAGDKEENRLIYLSGADNTGMSSFQKPENYSGKHETVKVVTLDSMSDNLKLPKIDVIKIDVEGNELAALKGMKEILRRVQPYILIELNPQTLSYFNHSIDDVLNYATELSYLAFKITEKGTLIRLKDRNISDTIDVLLVHTSRSDSLNHLLA
jgi:FkbM family methyltransferase